MAHDDFQIAVDFMDMTDDRHLWARAADDLDGLYDLLLTNGDAARRNSPGLLSEIPHPLRA